MNNGPPPPPETAPSLAQWLAWRAPQPPLTRWPPDPHLLLALVAAVPVWLALLAWSDPSMRVPVGLWAWCSLVLVQPVLEELVFRGLLQGQLLDRTTGRIGPISWANALTTLAFVALHLLAQPLIWALAVAVPSVVLGHLRERLGSVWPAVLVHAVYNTGFGLAAWISK